MRKYCFIFIAFIAFLLPLLASCLPQGFSSALDIPSSSPPDCSSSPIPSTFQGKSLKENIVRAKIFRSFLSDNYNSLSEAFYEGICGIGFIDLDQDGGIEMLLFDAGASAAMGLQFFDIINKKVECVSANMDSVRTTFGGKYSSDTVVNANFFQDFRLMQENGTGKTFFIVNSGNGAADFTYTELIRFGNADGILTLESLLYKYSELDIDTGDVTSESYEVNGTTTNATEYSLAESKLTTSMTDTNYAADGVFSWQGSYSSNLDSFLAMADEALLKVGL